MSAPQTLPARALAGYGIAAVPGQYLYVLILIMYLKYAVDDLGASASVVGTIFLVAKIWDAVSDPLVGNWSDRTHSRLGRRRSWLLLSAPLLAGFGIAAWAPPDSLDGVALSLWIAVSILGFYTAYTCFEVPHMALGAEITFDRQTRNRVFGVRQITRTLGMFAAGVIGVAVVGEGPGAVATMAWVVGALTLALVLGGVALMPPERADFVGRGGQNPYRAVRDVFANPHARLLLAVYFIESIGAGGIGVLTPFVVEHVMKMPEITPVMLGVYMTAALAGVPLWIRLGRRFEKRHLWLFAMVQGGIGYGLIFWVGEGSWLLMAISSVVAGSAGACGNTLGQAIKAEIVDVDEHRTGERKEGIYFAGWGFVGKVAGGIMIAVVGYALDWSGYVAGGASQTETVQRTMVFLMGGVPMIGFAIGSVLFSRFRLSEAEHARIREELDARARGEAASR